MVLIRVSPNIERAKSIYSMSINTLEMISTIDKKKYSSNIIKQYYDVIRELASVLMLLDGFKSIGDNAHKETIEYIKEHHKEFDRLHIHLMDELRILRNDISYEGFFIEYDYLERKEKQIKLVINALSSLVKEKLTP